MSKFKVGDIVKATTDLYAMTCKCDNWEGRVVGVDGPYFYAETTKTDNPLLDIGYEFSSLNAKDFELVNPHCTKEIHITEDDNIVHAVMKEGEKVIKRSKAICRAAITYNPAKNISFSTYAVKAMFNQVWNFRLYEMRKSPKEHMLSLEQDITIGQDDYSGRLSEMVSDHGSQIEEGYKRLYLSDLLTSLSERDKQILQLRMLGYNPKQISKILNISYTTMYNVLRKIKGRIKDND